MRYFHVDVFSSEPLCGNGLTVVFPQESLSDRTLLDITREFRQFETIFIYPLNADGSYPIRIFTVDEELDFAGHPIIGAGAVAHRLFNPDESEANISFSAGERRIQVHSRITGTGCRVTMNQGEPRFVRQIDASRHGEIAEALNLSPDDLDADYPLEVVSTGLPYLLVPLRRNLAACRIVRADFEAFLSSFAAKFVYVFETPTLECRTWDNIAHTEDAATGSAAGPLCAYLVKHNWKKRHEAIALQQGRFVGRPSVITGWLERIGDRDAVFVAGDVAFFASGTISL